MCVVFFVLAPLGRIVASMVRVKAVSQQSKMLRRRSEVMALLVAVTLLAMGVGTTARSHSEGENYFY